MLITCVEIRITPIGSSTNISGIDPEIIDKLKPELGLSDIYTPKGLPASFFDSDSESCHCHFTVLPVMDVKLQLMIDCPSLTTRYESLMEIQLIISRLS